MINFNDYYITTVGDMISEFIGNMSDEDIDNELEVLPRFARELGLKRNDYDNIVVLIDDDSEFYYAIDEVFTDIDFICNKINGIDFYYFRSEEDCKQFIEDYYKKY